MLLSYRRLLWGLTLALPIATGCTTSLSHRQQAATDAQNAAESDAETEGEEATTDVSDEDQEDVANTEPVESTLDEGEPEVVSTVRLKEEIEADRLSRQSFPLVQNEFVDKWINYFTGRGRKSFERWLGRSTLYIPLMKDVLKQDGLPEDLIYLAMIESGFNPKAKSHAKAVGPWQFIKGTGTRYGLEIGYWVDERRDFVKSSHAAATYLKELHQIFGSWYLAAAAYNAGEGKVLAAVRRDRSRNFWELARQKKNFRDETRNYVPKIIAAAMISKNPEHYGFSQIDYQEPFEWEFAEIPEGVDIRSVAEVIGTSAERLDILNAELVRGITPPKRGPYKIKVPKGSAPRLLASIDKLRSKKMKDFILHTVRRGDSLGGIARRYGSDVQEIMELNGIRSKKALRVGHELSIPIRERGSERKRARGGEKPSSAPVAESTGKKTSSRPTASRAVASTSGTYVVRRGDNLNSIAKRYELSLEDLREANPRLRASSRILPGQRLRIPTQD